MLQANLPVVDARHCKFMLTSSLEFTAIHYGLRPPL